ncbi:MAG: DUF6508 domain-containing protein [Methanoregula sp.]|nr:DUF6508 domain-containing protein [Methanoregula sp.]
MLKFLPKFEKPDFSPGSMHSDNDYHSGFEYSPAAGKFIKALYHHRFVVRFDWLRWQTETRDFYLNPEHIATADIFTLRRFLTIYVRRDYFSEGSIAETFESGQIVRILRRLLVIAEEMI